MGKGCRLLGTQHWRELLSQSEVVLELLNVARETAAGLACSGGLKNCWIGALL
jgi:hypothetical protein